MLDIAKIYEQYEDFYDNDTRNEVVKGLNILAEYSDDLDINPCHDELYAGFKDMEENMLQSDVHKLFKLGWRWSEDSFCIFT